MADGAVEDVAVEEIAFGQELEQALTGTPASEGKVEGPALPVEGTELEATDDRYAPRPRRVAIPILVSFSSDAYACREFTLNLSEGGIFLPTEKMCEKGTRGTLRFRTSQFHDPFDLEAFVVRVVRPGEEPEGQVAGLGMQFLDLDDRSRELLRNLVEGMSTGSIVQAIRQTMLESGRTLDMELRQRPTDQKMILAAQARRDEIDPLLRDGNPSVLIRLLDCPRLAISHVLTMLRNPTLPTRVVSAIKRARKWCSNTEVKYLICIHPNAVLGDAMEQLRSLPADRLQRVMREGRVRAVIKSKARELHARSQRGGRGGRGGRR